MRNRFCILVPLLVILVAGQSGCATHADRLTSIRGAYYGGRIAKARNIVSEALDEREQDRDVLKLERAMVELEPAIEEAGLAARMILQVHDELVFEAPASEVEALSELAQQHMRGVYALRVPLDVDVGVGSNWREAH